MLRVMPSIRAYTFTHTPRALCIHRALVVLKWGSFVAGFADLLDAVSRAVPSMRVRFTSPHPKDFPGECVCVCEYDRDCLCERLC